MDGGWLPQGLPPQLGLLLLLDDLDFDGLLLLGDLDEHLVASAGRLDHGGSGSAVGERLLAAAIRSRLRGDVHKMYVFNPTPYMYLFFRIGFLNIRQEQ